MPDHPLVADFLREASSPDPDLARAALVIARLEYPRLDPVPYLKQLDEMGAAAASRLAAVPPAAPAVARIITLNQYLFDELGFTGSREQYDDPRTSLLNQVLDRRTGIPITLALIYIEVARRAGLRVAGVNFPGHVLVRYPAADELPAPAEIILDPFHGGALLAEPDCRQLLQEHVGGEAAFDRELLAPATKPQILMRMLVNLKRTYVGCRSFPQAHAVTEMLLALSPSGITELRDRGLLAYHLGDLSSALRDLEEYLRHSPRSEEADEETKREQARIWEHVKTLRRRVASFN